MNEAAGCALLREAFEEAGYRIAERVALEVAGARVSLDGYDAAAKVGYEFITTEAGDRAEFTPKVVAALEERMHRGELYVLLVDEHEVDAERLRFAAHQFLERVQALRDAT